MRAKLKGAEKKKGGPSGQKTRTAQFRGKAPALTTTARFSKLPGRVKGKLDKSQPAR